MAVRDLSLADRGPGFGWRRGDFQSVLVRRQVGISNLTFPLFPLSVSGLVYFCSGRPVGLGRVELCACLLLKAGARSGCGIAFFKPATMATVALLLLLAAVARAAVVFTNDEYDIKAGKPFKLTWTDASTTDGGVNITLMDGPDVDLQQVLVVVCMSSRSLLLCLSA